MKKHKELVNSFLADLKARGRSGLTVRNYELYLRRFCQWLDGNNVSLEKLTLETIGRYKIWLKAVRNPIKKKNLGESTRNYHLIALRGFLRFLAKRRIASLPALKVKLASVALARSEHLEKTEIEKLLSAPMREEQAEILQLRDAAILEILYCTGLRVSEVANLRREQVDVKIRRIKFKKRMANFSNQAQFLLQQYLKKRNDARPFLFIAHDRAKSGRRPTPISSRSIERLVEFYARRAGIRKKVTPRMLRSTYARKLMLSGAAPEEIMSRLGHETILTAKSYFRHFN